MIGLITICDNNNIGNRLQNYAGFRILESYGTVGNIVRKYGCENKHFPEKKHFYLALLYHKFLNTFKWLFHPKMFIFFKKRKRNFNVFNKNINNSDYLSYKTNYSVINEKYSSFFVGSDQVWNPKIPGNGFFINMLGFVIDSNKKNAFAPSVSQDTLNAEDKVIFHFYLQNFKSLSCRESIGSSLIEESVQRAVTTLIDPTLMLSASDWNIVMKKPSFALKNNYLLVYLLGGLNKDYIKIIEYYARQYNLDIINILDPKTVYYTSGPSEFLYLVKNCKLFITDSYHGAIFSCIFGKNFKILERKNGLDMNSRFTNLKESLGINEDSFVSIDNYKSVSLCSTFQHQKLIAEQAKFKKYLDKVFGL